MNRAMIVLVLMLAVGQVAFATNAVYIAATSAGGNTGADCADAKAFSYFNTSGNWSGSPTGIQIGPDTTVHLCGTFSTTAGNGYLTFQGAGSSGHPIILKFETGAVLTSNYWQTNGAILNTFDYVTIDGGTNGTIQATDNGTAKTNQQLGNLIYFDGVSNAEIKNLTLANQYVHTANLADTTQGDSEGCIRWDFGSNVRVDHNTCHDAGYAVHYSYEAGVTSSNIELDHNTVYNINWGLIEGDGGAPATLNAPNLIHDNEIYDTYLWDQTDDNNHHDFTYCFATHAGSSLNSCDVYNNYLHGDPGGYTNTFIFLSENDASGACSGLRVWNNIVANTAATANHTPANGEIQDWCSGTLIVNNTFVGNGQNSQNALGNTSSLIRCNPCTGETVENNIEYDSYVGTYINGTVTTSDHNLYNTLSYVGWDSANTAYVTLANWQGCHVSGCPTGTHDANSSSGAPNLSGTYILQSGSAAIGLGTNLTSSGIAALDTGAPLSFGVNGSCGTGCVARPASGAWDTGAYEFASASAGSFLGGGVTLAGGAVIQ